MKYAIGIVIAGALILRLLGVDYGLPHFLVGDESSILGGALKMAELKNPIPATNPEAFRILYYPPFLPWLLLIILAPFVGITSLGMPLTEIREFFILHPETLLLIGRIFVALIGTASVYVLYRIVRRMFGEREGILAAILLALSFFHVSLSHFLRHWVPAALFILLAFYFAWQILEKKNPHAYLWGALTVGLGFGVSYVVGFGAILLVLAHFLSRTPFVTSLQDRQFWKMVIVMVLVMFVVFLLYPQEILRELSGQESPGGKTLTGYLDSFRYYGSVFLGLEPILAILSLVGVGLLWKTHRRLLWLIFIFTLLYISGLYFLFHHEPRYIILLVPLTAILGAIGLVSLGKAHPAAYTLLFIPLLFVLRYDQLLLRLDSRELLAEEIVRFSPDEKVIGFLPGLRVIPTKAAIRDLESRDPEALRTLERTLVTIPDERYPKEARSIVNLAQVRPERQAMITGYDYEARIEWREENIDIHGLFQGPIWKLFSIERFGPTTELIRL